MSTPSRFFDRITIVIGQPLALRELRDKARVLGSEGKREMQDEFVELQQKTAGLLIEEGAESPLAKGLSTIAPSPIAVLVAYVGSTYSNQQKYANIMIDLVNTKTEEGTTIESFLTKDNLNYISSLVGIATRAEWVRIHHITARGD